MDRQQVANFAPGLSEAHRISLPEVARTLFEVAPGYYSEEELAAVDGAWDALTDQSRRFGYRAGPLFQPEILFSVAD